MIISNGPRERILLMGGWGAGKSTAISDIADNVTGRVFVLDTTYEADRNFDGQNNIVVESLREWSDYVPGAKKAYVRGEPGDWLAVDRIDPVWEMAQDNFVEEMWGQSAGDWFLSYRKEKEGHPLAGEYGMNWNVIKKRYGEFMSYVMKFRGNVIVTAATRELQEPTRDGRGGDLPQVRMQFAKYGVRPAGEKHLGLSFHTILWLAEPTAEEWIFTTVRDRKRKQVKGQRMGSFSKDYLVDIAGWTEDVGVAD